MNKDENKDRHWKTFGKTSAGLLVTAGAIAALYAVGSGIYHAGYDRGQEDQFAVSYQTEQEMVGRQEAELVGVRIEHNRELTRLGQEGRLIPEDSCLRYQETEPEPVQDVYGRRTIGTSQNSVLTGRGYCEGLEVAIHSFTSTERATGNHPLVSNIETTFRDHRSQINASEVEVYQRNENLQEWSPVSGQ